MSIKTVSANLTRLEGIISSLSSLSIDTVTGDAASDYSVEGKTPSVIARPVSPQGISEVMSVASEHGLSVEPLGGMTRTSLGNSPDSLDLAVDMSGVNQVLARNAADLTATFEAGITVSRVQEILAEHGQFLAIDPPLPDRATIGGTLAVGWSGPMTWQNWSPRDIVIGMRTVMADGTITKTGGQVVKNVSGYDMARMHIGALGTLGIIAEVSFKLTPLPSRQATVMATFDSDASCLGAALAVYGSGLTPLAISTLHGQQPGAGGRGTDEARPSLLVRIGGRARSVQRQIDDVASIYRQSGSAQRDVIGDNDAAMMWRRMGDYGWTEETTPVAGIRANVLPSDTPRIIQSMQDIEDSTGLAWRATTQTAQGVVDIHWLNIEGEYSTEHVRSAISRTIQAVLRTGGTAVVTHAPASMKETLDVWGETTSAIDTMRNLKRQFDPNRVLNPGRFMGSI
ncbi:MAG: FAD-binding oxidoreductase [Chloroflexi bacterium]|nr:FAD-binding oxidoreductase [Chloroflexota bacterium]